MKHQIALIFLISTTLLRSQIANDNCANAGQLCPIEWVSVNNFNTSIQSCLSCQDDFDLCFTPLNTAWLFFNTYDAGDDLLLRIQNIQFDASVNNNNNSLNIALFKASVPCVSQSYELIHCINDLNTNVNEPIIDLEPNTLYYIVFSGTQNGPGALQPSQVSFQIRIEGPAVTRPEAAVVLGAVEPQICKAKPLTMLVDMNACPEPSDINWFKNGVLWLTTPSNGITTDDVENGDEFRVETTCYFDCPVAVTSNTIQITVYDFLVDAGANVTISQGQAVTLAGSTDQMDYFWSPPTGLNNPNSLNPIASPEITTTYYLTASNGICELVDEMTVFVISDLVIPDVFSPNGDGINDTWEILGTENFQEVYVVIFDRSGQKVFESVNYNPLRFWNGTFRNKALPTSTYFYAITIDRSSNNPQVIKGSVTIIR
jgi:gliding motility-associated-like protein